MQIAPKKHAGFNRDAPEAQKCRKKLKIEGFEGDDEIDIVVCDDVVPTIEVEDIEIYADTDPEDISDILDPDAGSLPDISDTIVPGDSTIITDPPPLITEGPGGGTVIIPSIPGIVPGDPGGDDSDDPIIRDPNDIEDIEDYTPETNPFLCS